MGGSDPPFIYDRPQSWNFGGPTNPTFNPKAMTEASWRPRTPKPLKKDGPLIDFNKHPDSYLILPYGSLNVQPMHPHTKKKVQRARKVQLLLRILSLIGALGLLFCVIAINKTTTAVAWIIRVAPAVALVHTLYGTYHLIRAATGRTPASTASYMVFAATVDTGLLPFFAFSAYLSYLDWTKNEYGWSTLFNDSDTSYLIIHIFFILSCVEGGLLLLSLINGIYLATMFRRIARMPPDMNPLEPNLTSRPGHKYKKSEMNVTETNMSNSALVAKRESDMANRRIPFIHTRTDSADSVTLYGSESARNSRLEMRKEFKEADIDPYRLSQASSRQALAPTRPSSAVPPAANARPAGAGLDHRPARSSGLAPSPARPSSWLSYLDYEGVPTQISNNANEDLDREVRPMTPVSAISSRGPSLDRAQAERENWFQGSARSSQSHMSPNATIGIALTEPTGNTVAAAPATPQPKRSREPLGMNPPTPPMPQGEYHWRDEIAHIPVQYNNSYPEPQSSPTRHVLTPINGNTTRPSSFVGSGTKSRFYGDLRASIGSIGSVGAENRKMAKIDVTEILEDDGWVGEGVSRSESDRSVDQSDYSGNIEVYGSESDYSVEPPVYQNQDLHMEQQTWNSPRQVSNSTGYDLNGGYAGLGAEFGKGMARRREVSGKVAEEGRGHEWAVKGGVHVVDEETTPKKIYGAAGWARFKGL